MLACVRGWFGPEMIWIPKPTGRRGRQRHFSDAAIQACLTLKVLFGMPLRQTAGFVESLLRLVGLDWEVPDFSTLCRRQKTLNVGRPYRGSKGPLKLLIASRDIATQCPAGQRTAPGLSPRAKVPSRQHALHAPAGNKWNARKHGGLKRRIWRKIHIGIDEETLEVRAVHCRQVIAWQSPRARSPATISVTPPCCQNF